MHFELSSSGSEAPETPQVVQKGIFDVVNFKWFEIRNMTYIAPILLRLVRTRSRF